MDSEEEEGLDSQRGQCSDGEDPPSTPESSSSGDGEDPESDSTEHWRISLGRASFDFSSVPSLDLQRRRAALQSQPWYWDLPCVLRSGFWEDPPDPPSPRDPRIPEPEPKSPPPSGPRPPPPAPVSAEDSACPADWRRLFEDESGRALESIFVDDDGEVFKGEAGEGGSLRFDHKGLAGIPPSLADPGKDFPVPIR